MQNIEEQKAEAAAATATTAAPEKKKKVSFKEQREFEILGKEIPELEKERETITEKMTSAGVSFDELKQLGDRIAVITGQLEEKEMRWLELSEMM